MTAFPKLLIQIFRRASKEPTILFRALAVVRVPAIAAGIAIVPLAYTDQVSQIYGTLAQEFAVNLGQIISASVLLILTTFVFWYMAQWHVSVYLNAAVYTSKKRSIASLRRLRWLPSAIAAMVPAIIGIGLYESARQSKLGPFKHSLHQGDEAYNIPLALGLVPGSPHETRNLVVAAVLCVLFAIAFLLYAALRSSATNGSRFLTRWISHAVHKGTYIAVAVAIVVFSVWPVYPAQALGSVAIFLLFLCLGVVIASHMITCSQKFSFPVFTVTILLVAYLSFSGKNTHIIVAEPRPPRDKIDPDVAFKAWYATRQDRQNYEQRGLPYPVFLVSAAGGGLYAAQHSAMFLARMQDHCPSFAQHIFALSGVSGGSFGVSVFAALANERAANAAKEPCQTRPSDSPGLFESLTKEVLQRDFLAPIIAVGLFPNVLQGLLPVPVARFDRASAFERAIEDAWDRTVPTARHRLTKPFMDTWTPSSISGALILNATDADRGTRLTLSPFRVNYITKRELSGVAWLQEDLVYEAGVESTQLSLDLKWSAAIGLSARFPVIVPPAQVVGPKADKPIVRRVIDGGYYENSGIDSILDVLTYLKQFEIAPSARAPAYVGDPFATFYVVVLNSAYHLPETDDPSAFLGLSPVRGLLSAREGRGHVAAGRAFLDRSPCFLPPVTLPCDTSHIEYLYLNISDLNIPLAWQLSASTAQVVARHAGRPITQEASPETGTTSSAGADGSSRKGKLREVQAAIRNNDRAFSRILGVLD